MAETSTRPLFQASPALRPLADLPMPLERAERLSAEAGAEIWIKRGSAFRLFGVKCLCQLMWRLLRHMNPYRPAVRTRQEDA